MTRRNAAALALTVGGVVLLTVIQLAAQPLGFVFAFGNCACFMAYVISATASQTPTGAQAVLLAASTSSPRP